jgi:hypothetical protein
MLPFPWSYVVEIGKYRELVLGEGLPLCLKRWSEFSIIHYLPQLRI